MSNTTLHKSSKPRIWQRVRLAIEAMEKTEADYQWDAIRALRSENEKLKIRVEELENSNPQKVDFSAITEAFVDKPEARFLRG